MEFLRYPQVIRQLFNGGRFGPPAGFTPPSSCSWIGHPVSGLIHATSRALHTRFPFASVPLVLKLAAYINSPDRSTKSTTSYLNVLCVLVNTGFRVLFHSPPGVLFTFPSRYFFSIGHQAVFRLRGWSPFLPRRFLVPARTPDPGSPASSVMYMTLTFFGRASHPVPLDSSVLSSGPYPGCVSAPGLASSAFARRYLRNLV